jgi:hypothetical protein
MKQLSLLLITALLLTATGVVGAQDTPLLMLVNGADVWSASTVGLTQLTTSGYNDRPVLSPRGDRFASKVIADIGIQALQTTGGFGIELPSDIEIHDVFTGAGQRIATQPPDATYNAGEPARAVVRSAPTWSPDGSALAWTEDVAPANVRQLVVYGVNDGSMRVLAADLPLQAGFQQTLPTRWGTGGIAVKSTTAAADNPSALIETILVYSPDGGLRSATTLQPAPGEFIYAFDWIDDGAPFVYLIYSSGRMELIDPGSGVVSALNGTPELYSLSNPGGLAAQLTVAGSGGGAPTFVWSVNGQPIAFNGPIEWITIAPAGDAVAYMVQGVAYIWRDGGANVVSGTEDPNFSVAELAWGATGWRVRR